MKKIILILLYLIYNSSFLISQNDYPIFVGSKNKSISYNVAYFNFWKNSINFENQNNRTAELGGSKNSEKNKFRYKQNYLGYLIVDSLNNPIDSNYYDGIYQTFEGLLYVKKSNTIWGAYNELKKLIYKPIYKDLYIYNDVNYSSIARIDTKFGLVNVKGENIINFDYDYMWPILFSNLIRAKNENEEYLFNINGTLIAKGSQVTLEKLGEKSIYYIVNLDGKKGVIDYDGNWLVELSEFFEYKNRSKENLNCFTYNKNGLMGFVFEKKDFYPIKFSNLVATFNMMNEPFLLFKDQYKYFLYDINKRCNVISDIEDIYDEFRPKFIKINQKWQRLSLEDVKKNYSKIEHFRGFYKVYEGNKCGIINSNDSIVLKIKYDLIKSLNNGCIYTLKNGKYKILGPNYLPITKANLDYIDENYRDEVFSRVSKAGKMYLIDKLGNYAEILEKPVTETEVNKVSKFRILNNGIFMGLVDSLGNTFLDPIYDLISTMNYINDSNFLFYVRKGDIRGFYNQDTFSFQ
ncbi:MAG: WG repeat-containing protein [Saprospiraceae bacterium]|nr:WG repeat-containing protein [Saprospiraceae bacterium]